MQGNIGFEGYEVKCIVGVEPHERVSEQRLIIDLKVEIDMTSAAISDDLHDTIDYVRLADLCREIAQKGRYHLIEKYAADVIQAIEGKFRVSNVWIRVKKPGALKNAACTFVELERRRK